MAALLADLEPEFGTGKIFRPFGTSGSAPTRPRTRPPSAPPWSGADTFSSPRGLAAGSGMYVMTPDQLARYREAVDSDRTGAELEEIIRVAGKQGIQESQYTTDSSRHQGIQGPLADRAASGTRA